MKPKRATILRLAIAGITLVAVTTLGLLQLDRGLRKNAHAREGNFVLLHFGIQKEFEDKIDPPKNLSQISPDLEPRLKPFSGNINLRRTGERSFILEEPEERWVSLSKKDRMVGDEKGPYWLGSGKPLGKPY